MFCSGLQQGFYRLDFNQFPGASKDVQKRWVVGSTNCEHIESFTKDQRKVTHEVVQSCTLQVIVVEDQILKVSQVCKLNRNLTFEIIEPEHQGLKVGKLLEITGDCPTHVVEAEVKADQL